MSNFNISSVQLHEKFQCEFGILRTMKRIHTQTSIHTAHIHTYTKSNTQIIFKQQFKQIKSNRISIGTTTRKPLHWYIRFEWTHNGNGNSTHFQQIWLH